MGEKITRCKVQCYSVTKRVEKINPPKEGGVAGEKDYSKTVEEFRYNASLGAVCDGSEENKRFWEFTPSGRIEFETLRVDAFKPGAFYYVDFSLAEK